MDIVVLIRLLVRWVWHVSWVVPGRLFGVWLRTRTFALGGFGKTLKALAKIIDGKLDRHEWLDVGGLVLGGGCGGLGFRN